MKKVSYFLITLGAVFFMTITGCKKLFDESSTSTTPVSKINSSSPSIRGMAWWLGFSAIKMPLDSLPNDIKQVHLFLLDMDANPNVALDTTHIIMQGYSWKSILESAHRLQGRGVKVIVSLMGHNARPDRNPGQYGIPAIVNPNPIQFGSITNPEAYAKTIKKRVIDDWKLDGVDLDIEDGYGGEAAAYNTIFDKDGNSTIDYNSVTNSTNFIKALSAYFGPKSGSGKLLIIDRGPNPAKIIPATYQYFDQLILQAYDWNLDAVKTAFNDYKPYFSPDKITIAVNGQRASDGWDENPKNDAGFHQYGTTDRAKTFSNYIVPGTTQTINMGIYQVAGDWSLGYPILNEIRKAQGVKK